MTLHASQVCVCVCVLGYQKCLKPNTRADQQHNKHMRNEDDSKEKKKTDTYV